MPLQDIETVVFVMLENRSFDHVLGYLGLGQAAGALRLEGLRDGPAWRSAQANRHGGQDFPPTRLPPEQQHIDDPPHDHAAIALQLARPRAGGAAGMGGFVDSYMTRQPPPRDPLAVMGYYDAAAVPVFDFLARNFAVCDHWFAALPCGTQPNRLMAMAGQSAILDNAPALLPNQDLVYDWLTRQRVTWCAYQSGDFLPFFALMPDWLPEITTSLTLSALGGKGRFRRYARFREHWLGTAPMPGVIFIEPEYSDGPHIAPNDDHPPTGIAKGQAFLADIYATLTANPARWRNTLMIVTYDEHGGFFDHVPPLSIPAAPGGTPLATTGPRVPALLVSPHVAPGVPFTEPLDHTSFLQLLADRFTPGSEYSPEVTARQAHLGRLSAALRRVPPPAEAAPSLPAAAATSLDMLVAATPGSAGSGDTANATKMALAFQQAARKIGADHPDLLREPQWSGLAGYVAGMPPDTAPEGANG